MSEQFLSHTTVALDLGLDSCLSYSIFAEYSPIILISIIFPCCLHVSCKLHIEYETGGQYFCQSCKTYAGGKDKNIEILIEHQLKVDTCSNSLNKRFGIPRILQGLNMFFSRIKICKFPRELLKDVAKDGGFQQTPERPGKN